jgi:hypothetical protein
MRKRRRGRIDIDKEKNVFLILVISRENTVISYQLLEAVIGFFQAWFHPARKRYISCFSRVCRI